MGRAPDTDAYVGLITPYHRQRPRYSTVVSFLTEPLRTLQGFIDDIPRAFDLDQAVGVQLDVVGEWVGRSRFVKIPIANAFFSFDAQLKGLDEGVWWQPFDTLYGLTRMDDDTYRLVLRSKIAANNWNGTTDGAVAAFAYIFPSGATKLFVDDNDDMTATYAISGKIPNALFLSLFSLGYVPIKSAGIQTDHLVVSVDSTPMFGFDVSNGFVGGFDNGSWGVTVATLLGV